MFLRTVWAKKGANCAKWGDVTENGKIWRDERQVWQRDIHLSKDGGRKGKERIGKEANLKRDLNEIEPLRL